MKMTINGHSLKLRKVPKTKTVSVNIGDEKILYQVQGDQITLIDGTVPADIKIPLEQTISLYFRTKV